MKCPQCGTPQPFDVKCVHCNTDIAASLKSERISIRFYRVALFALLVTTIWVAQDKQTTRPVPSSSEEQENTANSIPQPQLTAPLKIMTPPQRKEAAVKQTVGILLRKDHLADFLTFDSLRTNYRSEIKVIDENEARLWEENPLVVIGAEAARNIVSSRPSYPLLLLSAQEDLSASFDPRQKIYGVASLLNADYELIVLHQLFEGINQFTLISAENARKPNAGLLRELNIRVDSLQADAVTVERELPLLGDGPSIVWLHRLSGENIAAILSLRSLEKEWSVVGLHSGDLENTQPLVELKISPAGLGMQGAYLLRRLQSESEISETDMLPKYALEINIRFKKALELGREDLVTSLQERARRSGYQTKLVP